MDCYICHRAVKHHEYTRHIASHIAGNDPQIYHAAGLDPSYYGSVVHEEYHGALPSRAPQSGVQVRADIQDSPAYYLSSAPFTQSNSTAPTTSGDTSQRVTTNLKQPEKSNSFEMWLKCRTRSAPYTAVDGHEREPESRETEFRREAEVLQRTTKGEIIKIVESFQGFPCNDDKKTCLGLVEKAPVLPGLVAYTYTHLVVCPNRSWFSKSNWSYELSKLKRLLEDWENHDITWPILFFDEVKNELLMILRACKSEEHRCNLRLLNGTMILDYDILNLAASAALCITGPRKDDVLVQRGIQAEKLAELFFNLLEANVKFDEPYRRYFFNALALFSKEAGCCPRGIYLPEDTIKGILSTGAEGGFGMLYKGTIGSSNRLVAVKALKRSGWTSSSEYNKDLVKEAIVWRHLRHPNCLPFYGVYIIPERGPNIRTALVSPWMEQGNLSEYLVRNPRANRAQLMLDVVRGLDYLHSMQPHVAHRDIKPDNILVTNKKRACLADFGLASTFDADKRFRTATSQISRAGTRGYMAPEIFKAETRDALRKVNKRACDMYALGCTIYAAYTDTHPFEDLLGDIGRHVVSGRRPAFPKGKISLDMWSFVENLWSPVPSERLTAKEALEWMELSISQKEPASPPCPEDEWEWKGSIADSSPWSLSL